MDSSVEESAVVKEEKNDIAVPAMTEKPKISDVDTDDDGLINYKDKYRNLKRKLKCLLFEQECFHEELRKVQRKCLRVNRDKSFLLDHLMKYEEPDMSSTDEDMTESTEDEQEYMQEPKKVLKKKKKKNSSGKAKSLNKSTDQKNANIGVVADKVRCKKVENGKQCPKLVSTKVKSGLCYAHRQQIKAEKQDSSINSPESSSPMKVETCPESIPTASKTKPTGGKDISQIREAMEPSISAPSENASFPGEEDDDLVIDLPT